ncbi:hypothetical protein [Ulvibacterium sp.]|uniref:hypothetical protein n=1 Tax=Ulvibacterium sp. TaxID=2665914 RepID=UPI002618998B|nr:hypothetical protein [Ulvibacterium sp.]
MSVSHRVLKTPIRVSIAILLLGMLAQVLQLPYASEIMLFAFGAIGILYTIRFWKKMEKKFIDYVKLVLVVFWTTNGIFRILDFPYTIVFQVIIAVSFLTWFVMEGTAYFLDEDRKAKNSLSQILWNCAMVLGTLAIICGSLLKILHWDYAMPLFAGGIAIVGAYILKDVFPIKSLKNEDGNHEEFQL